MMIYGYARVSAEDQSLETQLAQLKEYGCNEIIQEKISGVAKDKKLFDLVKRMNTSDKLVITRVDRLGRSTLQSIALAEEMHQRGLELVILESGIDTTTTNGKLFFEIMCSFSQWERQILKEKQQRGIELARARGVRIGRQSEWTREGMEEAIEMYKENRIVKEITRITHVSRAALYRELKRRGITRT